MKAWYENDPLRPGYGFMMVDGVNDAVPETVRYTLLRASDHKSLHPQGWQDSTYALTPDAARTENGVLRLSVGPEVVAELDELDTCRLLVHVGESTYRAPLELAGIVYPPCAGSGSVPGVVAPPAPVPEPHDAPVPEEVAPPPAPPESLEPDAAVDPVQPPLEMTANTEQPSRSRTWIVPLVAALLVLAGAALWKFMPRNAPDKNAGAVQENVAPASPSPKAEEKAPSPSAPLPASPKAEEKATPPSAPPQPAPAETPSPLEQARALLRSGASPQQALELGNRLATDTEADAHAADAAFLLFETAAEGGQPEAMLKLGGFYDPDDAAPKGSIQPDAEQAWIWYGKADAAGQAGAAERKAALRARLEDRASAGSSEARTLLERLR